MDIPFWQESAHFIVESIYSLNPSFNGYSFLTYPLCLKSISKRVLILLLMDIPFWRGQDYFGSQGTYSLNPSFNGYSFLTWHKAMGNKTTVMVLILLLMDIPFWQLIPSKGGKKAIVLILLLMDIPFWPYMGKDKRLRCVCLNPSFNGYSFLTLSGSVRP